MSKNTETGGLLSHAAARNFFMYILMFVTLYITAVSAGGAIRQIINLFVADPLFDYFDPFFAKEALRGFISALIVAGPIYLFMANKLTKEAAKDKSLANSAIRRWLTYLTLLVASIVVIITLIMLVHNLLSGETTMRFFLNMLNVLGISGLVFGYYLWDLKK